MKPGAVLPDNRSGGLEPSMWDSHNNQRVDSNQDWFWHAFEINYPPTFSLLVCMCFFHYYNSLIFFAATWLLIKLFTLLSY